MCTHIIFYLHLFTVRIIISISAYHRRIETWRLIYEMIVRLFSHLSSLFVFPLYLLDGITLVDIMGICQQCCDYLRIFKEKIIAE